jgi:hypothetical protein
MAFRTVDLTWWTTSAKSFAGFMWSPEWKTCGRIATVFAINELGFVSYVDGIGANATNAINVANAASAQVSSYDPPVQAVRSQEFKDLCSALTNFAANDPSGNPYAGDLKTYAEAMLNLLNTL